MHQKKSTQPAVFIIESLRFKDEKNNRLEGQILSHILQLNNISSEYYYFRTKKELIEILEMFEASDFRYLHVSCHGSGSHIHLTLDDLTYLEFGNLVSHYLFGKRLFLSACQATNSRLIKNIIPGSGCNSVIGPVHNIEFRDAAISWAAFYHLMFKSNPSSMKRDPIIKNLQKVVDTFEQPLNYFFKNSKTVRGYKKKVVNVRKVRYNLADQDAET